MRKIKYRSFTEARKFVRSLNLKNDKPEWRNYAKSGKKPDDIPSNPRLAYKDKGWISVGDWLGTGVVARQKQNWRSFTEARKFVHSLKLKNYDEWKEYFKSGKRPADIPTNPYTSYKNKGWINYVDWLGTNKNTSDRNFMTFEECKKIVHKLKLKNMEEWNKYCKSGKLEKIPTHPERKFKKEWISYGDWLGTNFVALSVKGKNYLPWKEAKPIYRRLAKEYGIKNGSDWIKFAKTHKKLLDDLKIAAKPSISYTKAKVWKKMK